MKRGYTGKEYPSQKRFKPTTRAVVVYPNRVVQPARGAYVQPYQRPGYGSVSRARGAAVTGEMKYFDCDLHGSNLVATTTTWPNGTVQDPGTTINLGDAAVATPLCLFAPKVSAALNGRIGRKCRVLKIKVMGTLLIAPQAGVATADAGMTVRLLLVQDCQSNATQMTAAQLLNDATANGSTIHAMQNPNNFGRFIVHKDKKYTFADFTQAGEVAAANLVQGSKAVNFKMTKSFKIPIQINFNATNGGTVADIIDHSFHVVAAQGGTAVQATISYYSRVCYKE